MFKTLKSKVAAASIGLALIGSSVAGGTMLTGIASAQTTANPPTVTQPAESATELPAANEPTTEQAEPNEPALPGGGHADAAGADAVHEFDGIE